MQSIIVNKEKYTSIDWEEDCYKYCEFYEFTPEGIHITSDFTDCTFRGIDWYWGIFNIVNFVGCKFINCTFRGTSFPNCKFVECQFEGTKFIKDNLNGSCHFEGAVAYGCTYSGTEGFEAETK